MSAPRRTEARVEQAADDGLRLDVFVAERLGLFTRSQARARIVEVTVNGAVARLARRVKTGDVVCVTWTDPPPPELQAEEMPLVILFENDDVVVLDKPQGLVVHPGSGNHAGTLVNGLLFRYSALGAAFGGEDPRPGIVHRLDKDTSGVIIVARNPRAHEALAAQFRDRSVRKRYVAIVQGIPSPAEGRIDARLARDRRDRKKFRCVQTGGRTAVTRYRVLRTWGTGRAAHSLVLFSPRTGRTHQLRVHARAIGMPILGDPLYGARDPLFPEATLMLHAASLRITLPGETEPRLFSARLPSRFRAVVKQLQSSSPRRGL
jgi:23S rRNA pseudouridine1911/1915/1917 synthase